MAHVRLAASPGACTRTITFITMIELRINGEVRHFDTTPTVSDILVVMGLNGKRIAVERNGSIVPKSLHANTRCAAGDALEIVVAVGGG